MKLLGSFFFLLLLASAPTVSAHGNSKRAPYHPSSGTRSIVTTAIGDETGIKELVPQDFRHKYRKWKDELLSTEFGRQQWEYYASNKGFLLKIVVVRDRKFGAGTDDFEWNEEGELIGATITLGKDLDEGYPDPVYYPIMNSLATYDGLYEVKGSILASTKIVHEIGHVKNTAELNGKVFQRQNKLIASYNSIFLKNGYDVKDPRLVELADELGGKPVEIWETREYQSELNALRYLVERIEREPFGCAVFSRMKRNLTDYVRNHRDQFVDLVEGAGPNACN